MVRFCKMFIPKVLSVIALLQSVYAGYDYPKPSVPFELPIQNLEAHHNAQNSNQVDQKTISYSIPYEDYSYLHHHKNKIEKDIDNGSENLAHQNLDLSALQDLTSHELINTKSNANIDGVVSVESTVELSHVTREQDPINAQPILDSVPNSQVIISPPKIVPPVINLQAPGFQVLQSQNIQETNIPNVINNVPSLLNAENQRLASVNNNLSPVLNLLGNNQPITNVQNSYLPPPSEVNVPTQLINVQNSNHINAASYSEVSVETNYGIPRVVLPLQQNGQSNIDNGISNTVNINNNIPQLLVQNNLQSINNYASNLYQQDNVNLFQNARNLAEPKITKHIYFHVPPPDIEEPPVVRAPLPPKKIYKIVFIKLPSQESQNNAQLQALLSNQLAPIEDKTLIYLLVKKPESTQVVLPQQKVSEHEVLFVKYKENKRNSDLDNAFVRSNALDNDELALQPGLVNGNK